ncbi:hypothetical protein [Ruminococcus albus]|uniref:hypothetical protein n=1 Tax=Ruminococcus albus TaxID=1264 RepID=UPI0004669245|nr:hypothetical protein [Ruminococcus albus]
MMCVIDCKDCKNRLPNIDGWLACCKAFPDGYPKEFNFIDLKKRKECNNGIGFEPIEDNDKPSE